MIVWTCYARLVYHATHKSGHKGASPPVRSVALSLKVERDGVSEEHVARGVNQEPRGRQDDIVSSW